MEKELQESLERYAELEKQLVANKQARMATPRFEPGTDQETEAYAALASTARELRDAYIAEERVRNSLVERLAKAQAKAQRKADKETN